MAWTHPGQEGEAKLAATVTVATYSPLLPHLPISGDDSQVSNFIQKINKEFEKLLQNEPVNKSMSRRSRSTCGLVPEEFKLCTECQQPPPRTPAAATDHTYDLIIWLLDEGIINRPHL